MSKRTITTNKTNESKEIAKSESPKKWLFDTISSNSATVESTLKKDLKCTCNKKFVNSKTNKIKKKININLYQEKKMINTSSDNLNTLNSTKSSNFFQVPITDEEVKEKRIEKLSNDDLEETRLNWKSLLFIQIMERLQYLASEPPELYAQFPDALFINRTINNDPIKILIPIPNNYIQIQERFQVISQPKILPEQPKLIKPVAQFALLEMEQFEMFIDNKNDKVEIKEPIVQPLVKESHSLDILQNQRMWKGSIRPVKTNKIGFDIQVQNWNEIVKTEKAHNFEFIKKKKEIIIPKVEKIEKPQYSLSQESKITLGGKGFHPKIWSIIPVNEKSLTILSIPIQKEEEKENIPEPSIEEEEEKEETPEPSIEEEEEEKEKTPEPSIEESISVIHNNDYHKVKNFKIRRVNVTVFKKREDEQETSTDSLDVFEEIFIKKIELNIEEEKKLIKSRFEFIEENQPEEGYKIGFKCKNKKFNNVCK